MRQKIRLIFLGTGAAWGLPELACTCSICRNMRQKGQSRTRPALLLQGKSTLLIDCGPDIRRQLDTHGIKRIDGVLISHEHGDHYLGLDELFAYKRISPRGAFNPIPLMVTETSWKVIRQRFGYLEAMGVIKPHLISPQDWYLMGEFMIFPFDTEHGDFAKGSVGFLIKYRTSKGHDGKIVYTSDFMDIPLMPREILEPDYLIIQSFWLNEPLENRPHHMSFQRALDYIQRFSPSKNTFLVHMGDADMVEGDPANVMTKKYIPKDPLKNPVNNTPYPVPLDHDQWQELVDRILKDHGIDHRVTVAYDNLILELDR